MLYGLGSVAYGVKDNGFQSFLLLFYNQIIGLKAEAVGAAIGLALIVDSVMDPIVGHVSDHWRSRWGRRHPFMYAAALPVAVSYLMLWNPPHLQPGAMFVYLVVIAIVVRTFITFYEVPSAALVPELTQDYDQRTSLLGYRYFFGWWGGMGMSLAAYQLFLRPTAQYRLGQLNPEGYRHYGLAAAIVMLLAILLSSVGTHRLIPYLRRPASDRPSGLATSLKQMAATLGDRAFLTIVGVGFFASAGQGVVLGLSLYVGTYFWLLTPGQISILILNAFVGALLAINVAPRLGRRMDKKAAAFSLIATGVLMGGAPLALRLMGLAPANESPGLLPFLMAFGVIGATAQISGSIFISSMIADIVEHSELKTGRRSEGLFFAANSFVQKTVTGLGLAASGLILAAAKFPAGAKAGLVSADVLRRLALIYLPSYATLYAIALLLLCFYGIDRATHLANLQKLSTRDPERLPQASGQAAD